MTSYQLTWHSTGEVLRLDLLNKVSLDEMKVINGETINILDKSDRKLILLIDASSLKVDYATVDQLRMTQLYRDHPKLSAIVVVADNKMNRLITLLAFHLSKAHFIQLDSAEQAQEYFLRHRESRSC
jgi:hypothetical protein